MFERGEWLRIWIVLSVVWTIVVATLGWINLPRAQCVPPDPEFLNRLPNESALILNGSETKAEPFPWGALIWSDAPISVAMPNGARLAFPSTATNERIEFVRKEYSKVLDDEAGARRKAYALEMIITWLLPYPVLLVLGWAAGFIRRMYQRAAQNGFPGPAVAGWMETRKVTGPLRIDRPPGYEPGWSVAARHMEHGF